MVNPLIYRRYRCITNLILVLLCISFLLIFTNCGIPSLIHLEDGKSSEGISYYDFESLNEDIPTNFEVAFQIYNQSQFQIEQGPSLAFFYAIVPSDTLDDSEVANNFIKKFNNKYSNISSQSISSMPDIEVKIDDKNYELFPFSYKIQGDNNLIVQNPETYAFTFDTSKLNIQSEYKSTFSISKNVTDEYIEIKVSDLENDVNKQNYHLIDSSNIKKIISNVSFLRKNGESFPLKSNETGIEFVNFDGEKDYRVLIFSALNINKGSFTNIFWSKLNYLGKF